MSYHSNNNQNKCWSCDFFCGERKYKSGIFGVDSTETSSNGTCLCKRSTKYNKTVSENNWCSKYQKWGVLTSAIDKRKNEEILKKQRLEDEKNKREIEESNRIARMEQIQLERERIFLEQERKKLEYERWYMSLSRSEKIAENNRIRNEEARKKQEVEEQRRKEELEDENNYQEAAKQLQNLVTEINYKNINKAKKEYESAERLLNSVNKEKYQLFYKQGTEKLIDNKEKIALVSRRKKNKMLITMMTFISIIVALCTLSIVGYVQHNKKMEEELNYYKNETGYTVYAGNLYKFPKEMVIPSYYKGEPVTAVKKMFSAYTEELEKIIIPDTVTKIMSFAFTYDDKRLSIVIPDSVTYMESYIFTLFPGNSYFQGNHSSLMTIIYLGTKEQWNTIIYEESYEKSISNANVVFQS